MTLLMAIFLGIVQGITEFLPISSSGHLSLFQNLLGLQYSEDDNLLFDVLLHLGTLVAICIYYRKDIKEMITGCVDLIKGERTDVMYSERLTPPVRTLFFIVIGTLPLFIAMPFYDKISSLYNNTWFIGCALIVTGFLLFVSDRYIKHGHKNGRTMTLRDAIIIGVAQMLALVPGLSRSGTTISVATACGFDRRFAVRYSLLLSLPAVLGSTLLSIIKAVNAGIDTSKLFMYLIGFVFSAVVGYFAIGLLRAVSAKGKFGYFAYYCWAVGALAIILTIVL